MKLAVRRGELETRNDDLVFETISVGDIVVEMSASMNQRAARRFLHGRVPN